MRRWLAGSFVLVALAAAAVWLPISWSAGGPRPLPVPAGDREVVWIGPNTSDLDWQRFAQAVRQVAGQKQAAKDDPVAWVAETSFSSGSGVNDYPEVVLAPVGGGGKLRFRWYKTTSTYDFAQWSHALAARRPAPLAVVSNGSSERASDLATHLNKQEGWKDAPPLLLLTSATANQVANADGDPVSLITIHKNRSFRFCFSNRQMAEALLRFLRAKVPGLSGPDPPQFRSVVWRDEPYSADLSENFRTLIKGPPPLPFDASVARFEVPDSIGGFSRPTVQEAKVAENLLAGLPRRPGQSTVLLMPNDAQPARRLLRAFVERSPDIGRYLVVVAGDSLGMNTLYRDGDLLWNGSALPVPLVAFAHFNPVGWEEVPDAKPNGTDNLLGEVEVVRRLAAAAVERVDGQVRWADDVAGRLRKGASDGSGGFFDERGNRNRGGEYIIWLRPDFTAEGELRVLPRAELTIFKGAATGEGNEWDLIRTVEINYGNDPRPR